MSSTPTTVDKLRALPWSIASNAALAVYLQLTFFGSLFILFLDELGLSKGQMGFILSLLPFTGLLSVPVAPATARFGYKRTTIVFFTARTLVTTGLLLTPWVTLNYGNQAAVAYVAGVVLIFALFRVVGVTGSFPWIQEYVPNSVRGKYTATNNIFSTLTGFVAVTLSAIVLARVPGLGGFILLIAIGVVFGLISAWLLIRVPGGAPVRADLAQEQRHRDLGAAVRDRDFRRFLGGIGLYTLATVPIASFLPLFMQEEVGLSAADTVRLQNGVLLGALISSYLWGWFADRYGSKPVMLYGVALRMLLIVGWLAMPRQSALSLAVALGIALMQGIADVGWQVGSARLLYVSAVPPDKKGDYMALYWAWLGLAGGISQLIGGRLLELSQDLEGQLLGLTLDPYLPLFLLSLLLPLAAIVLLRRIRDDSTIGMGQFAGIFLRGNPLLAMEAVMRFHRARDEESTVRVTERLGQSKSPLTVEELLEALDDPRFNVRYEAIISIARMAPDPRLIAALGEVLEGPEPALSTVAAWALGRLGDARAIEPLQDALHSRYRSVQAHSLRSLGVLEDRAAVPALLDGLARETDVGLQLAYASALGRMQVTEATGLMLETLRNSPSRSSRQEMALDVARLVGDEHRFINLLRQVRKEPGTALAQAVLAVKKRVEGAQQGAEAFVANLEQAAGALAREELQTGLALLAQALRSTPAGYLAGHQQQIVEECAGQLEQQGAARLEYAILALHALLSP